MCLPLFLVYLKRIGRTHWDRLSTWVKKKLWDWHIVWVPTDTKCNLYIMSYFLSVFLVLVIGTEEKKNNRKNKSMKSGMEIKTYPTQLKYGFLYFAHPSWNWSQLIWFFLLSELLCTNVTNETISETAIIGNH